MNEKQIIDEMADILCQSKNYKCDGEDCKCIKQATDLYNAGYRNCKEFAEKVKNKIKEIKKRYHEDYINGLGDQEYDGITESDVDEIAKEYGVEV